jgi:uncharacterized protein (DUF2141 family)
MMPRRVLKISTIPVVALLGAANAPGTLRVEVSNVRARTGTVHVDICTRAQFLKDCPLSAEAPAKVGTTIVTITDLPPGNYAAQVFYDENGNHKIDRALFGVPREGVGFSNDAKIHFAPPKWADAVFAYDGQPRTIRLRLRYFIGPDAPTVPR